MEVSFPGFVFAHFFSRDAVENGGGDEDHSGAETVERTSAASARATEIPSRRLERAARVPFPFPRTVERLIVIAQQTRPGPRVILQGGPGAFDRIPRRKKRFISGAPSSFPSRRHRP